ATGALLWRKFHPQQRHHRRKQLKRVELAPVVVNKALLQQLQFVPDVIETPARLLDLVRREGHQFGRRFIASSAALMIVSPKALAMSGLKPSQLNSVPKWISTVSLVVL